MWLRLLLQLRSAHPPWAPQLLPLQIHNHTLATGAVKPLKLLPLRVHNHTLATGAAELLKLLPLLATGAAKPLKALPLWLPHVRLAWVWHLPFAVGACLLLQLQLPPGLGGGAHTSALCMCRSDGMTLQVNTLPEHLFYSTTILFQALAMLPPCLYTCSTALQIVVYNSFYPSPCHAFSLP